MHPIEKALVVHEGSIKLSGWAYSGGGHWPVRVEVSGDGGSVWYEVPYANMSEKHFHAWRTWSIELPVDAEGWLELVCRCWDNALNTQPTYVRSAWCVSAFFPFPPLLLFLSPPMTNSTTYTSVLFFLLNSRNWDLHVTSSCHRIKVFSVNKSKPATAKRIELLQRKGVPLEPITKPLSIDLEEDEEWETEMQRRRGRDPED